MSHRSTPDDPLAPVRAVVGTSTPAAAVVGALVAFLIAFVPGSPFVGGVVAGWLVREDRGRGAVAGVLAGFLFSLPTFLATAIIFSVAVGISLLGAVPAAFGLLLVVFALLSVAYTLGLGAIGGYVGVAVYESRYRQSAADATGGARTRDSQFDDTQF